MKLLRNKRILLSLFVSCITISLQANSLLTLLLCSPGIAMMAAGGIPLQTDLNTIITEEDELADNLYLDIKKRYEIKKQQVQVEINALKEEVILLEMQDDNDNSQCITEKKEALERTYAKFYCFDQKSQIKLDEVHKRIQAKKLRASIRLFVTVPITFLGSQLLFAGLFFSGKIANENSYSF